MQNATFTLRDLSVDPIEPADLLIVRDVMGHLPYKDAINLLRINKDKCKYMLLTHFDQSRNEEIDAGQWYPIDLIKYPFSLGSAVLELIFENPKAQGISSDKMLVLVDTKKIDI